MPAGDLWIIYALIFGAAVFAIQGGYWLIVRTRREHKAINRRIALGSRINNPSEVLETLRRERGFGSRTSIPGLKALQLLIVQSGLRINWSRLLVWLLFAVAIMFLSFFYFFRSAIPAVLLALLATFLGAILFLLYVRHKRIALFGEQFPEALDVIVRGLKAGHPFRVAVGLVSRELPDPIGSEFGILADEVTFGLDLNVAVGNLCDRVGHDDLSFFVIAINIQSQTGGNLAEVLSRLSRLIRSRSKLKLKIRAITSEGRLSAVFLSLAPFILFLIITLISPAYFGEIRNHPAVVPATVFGLVLLGLGNIIMYRMVHFKV